MTLAQMLIGSAGLLALAVAFLLLARAPSSRATRVFAFYLVLWGLSIVLRWFIVGLSEDLAPVAAVTWPYFLLPSPFLLAVFAIWYPEPRGRLGRSRALLPAMLAVGLGLDVLYALDHSLFTTGVGAPTGPLYLVRVLDPLFVTGIVLLFVRDFTLGRAPAHGSSLLILAAALAIDPAYTATRTLLYWVVGLTTTWSLITVAWTLALVPVLLALGLLAQHARLGSGPSRATARRAIPVFALGLVGAAITTAIVRSLPPLVPYITGIPAAVFAIATPLLVAYALLRHRLFDIDLRVKRTIRESTVIGCFAAVLLITWEGAQVALPAAPALLLGLGAVAGLSLAMPRLRRLGDRVAERALPEVAEDPAYLNARKLSVYRAALEEALVEEGDLPPREATRLAALRGELGLSDRDHAVLSFAVRSARMPWRPRPLEPGALLLGRYRIQRALGEGANGATYLAEDEANGQALVAVKALRPERGGDPEALREARAMQAVRHPRVVAMHEVAEAAGQAVIVMEYMEGGSLADHLAARGRLRPAEFRRVAVGLLEALEAVHGAGAVHRDVKPSNVLLTQDGEPKLADFGIAQVPGFETTVGGGQGDLTAAVGTIRFMSPEQARGRRVSARSDLFSAGATLYEAYTGQAYLAPLPGESPVELQMRAAAGQPFPRGWKGPPALRAWFARALHPQPEARFASGTEMRAALERALAAPRAA